MTRRNRKDKMVVFKAGEELADFLGSLSNSSEFIRKAILSQFRMRCPLCRGSGVVPLGVGEHYEGVMGCHSRRQCDGCGATEPIPKVLPTRAEDAQRWGQFLRGGPLYCRKCFRTAPPAETPGEDTS